MTDELDCRGLACPAPVLKTKKAVDIERTNEIHVVVDNQAAKENVRRFLESQCFDVSIREGRNDFHITGIKTGESISKTPGMEKPEGEKQKIMVMIATDHFGTGDDDLGKKLMQSFLKTLKEVGEELWRIVFVNNGVKLTIEGSEVLPDLKDLEGQKIPILVCGTCLNHFDLLDKKQVGETTNMLDIVTAMQLADKVINI